MKKKGLLLLFCCLVLLTGCWDQRLFKDAKLIMGATFDLTDDGQVKDTVSVLIPDAGTERASEGSAHIETGIGNNLFDARSKIDQQLAYKFDPSKLEVLLIGEEIAKQDIYSILDGYYRAPRNNLSAEIAVVEGEAAEVFTITTDQEPRISEHIVGLLDAVADTTHSHGDNVQLICAELFEPGIDIALPLLSVDKDANKINYKGLALFHDKQYHGTSLNAEQATLLLLMDNKKGKVARITRKVSEKGEPRMARYLSAEVTKHNRDLKIIPSGGTVSVDINLDLYVNVVEYPLDKLTDPKKITELEKKLSETLTKEAEEVISLLQEAHSDVLGIGRRTEAFHYDTWKQMDWEEEFKTITITPKVNVVIQEHGTIG
ncbi:germination protein KC [Thalassobacillus devorans]|uniref:Germination protein KC n=1 Tax=Thalassobacillus devorans TaxID=279813 RepID=A0ABQ1PSF5_9BACI|nr:Ger(x)C family spore germination protein [Thalassobacillus devorans]NIK30671.1 Ger(x)C family germination protein [Thalassobacillus devorans]GGD02833.1 germination protein KC [Thalassobacillus devorans]